jgi:hypothetical protein
LQMMNIIHHGSMLVRMLDMPNECQYFKNNPQDLEHAGLYEENRRHCYDVGYAEGKNSTLFNKKKDSACSEFSNSYEQGFSAGCQSIQGNTDDSCELTIKGDKVYCPTYSTIFSGVNITNFAAYFLIVPNIRRL